MARGAANGTVGSIGLTAYSYVLTAPTCNGFVSENAPLTRRPGAVVLGSATVSDALSAVEVTEAVIVVEYSRVNPG